MANTNETKDKGLTSKEGQIRYNPADLSRKIFDALKVSLFWAGESDRELIEKGFHIFSQIVEQSPVTVVITDLSGRIEYVNPKFTQTTGYSREEALGQTPRILTSGVTKPADYKQMWEVIAGGGEWRGEFYNKRKDGSYYWESALIAPISNADGDNTHYLAIKEDITERKNAEESLRMSEARLDGIVRLLEQDDLSVQDFLDKAMVLAIELTQSQIGYIYLYNETDETLVLASCFSHGMQECMDANPLACEELIASGFWREAVRLRKPMLINDFRNCSGTH